jgi:PAN domain
MTLGICHAHKLAGWGKVMRVLLVAFVALLGLAFPAMADDTPDISHVRTFHNVGPLAGLKFATDADAQKLVDELLGYLGLHADYQIYVTDNANAVATAAAGYDVASQTRYIFFNRAFMQKYVATTHNDLGLYFIAAHELSHLIALHALRQIDPIQKELEADYYAGFILGVKNKECDKVVAAIGAFPDQAAHERTSTYPALAQRRVAVGRGCSDATGELTPELANAAVSSTLNVPSILNQFTTRVNRDIYGEDLALIAGQPGIPGSTIESCAHVCFGLPSCKGFTFNQWNNFCYLKGSVKGESVLHPAGIIGVKKPAPLPNVAQTTSATIKNLYNEVFADAPISALIVADLTTCRKACLGTDRCVAYSFFRATKECRQFNLTEGFYHDDGFDSGYKYQEPDAGWLSTLKASK